MKRLALIATATVMAIGLAACGDNAEKKVENKADTEVQQTKTQLDNANKDVNKELNDSAKPAESEAAPAAPAAPATEQPAQ